MSRARNNHSRPTHSAARRILTSPSIPENNLNLPPDMSTATSSKTDSDSHTAEDLKALLHEAEQALSSTAGEAGEKFDELRERLRDALDSGKYSFDRLRAE